MPGVRLIRIQRLFTAIAWFACGMLLTVPSTPAQCNPSTIEYTSSPISRELTDIDRNIDTTIAVVISIDSAGTIVDASATPDPTFSYLSLYALALDAARALQIDRSTIPGAPCDITVLIAVVIASAGDRWVGTATANWQGVGIDTPVSPPSTVTNEAGDKLPGLIDPAILAELAEPMRPDTADTVDTIGVDTLTANLNDPAAVDTLAVDTTTTDTIEPPPARPEILPDLVLPTGPPNPDKTPAEVVTRERPDLSVWDDSAASTGAVVVAVGVDRNGDPTWAAVIDPSTSQPFNEEAVRAARASTFAPADIRGLPAADTVRLLFTYSRFLAMATERMQESARRAAEEADRDDERDDDREEGESESEPLPDYSIVIPEPEDFVPLEMQPEMLHRETPEYPQAARQDSITGSVEVQGLVNPRGQVQRVIIANSSGDESLDAAAEAAALRCIFKPGVIDGQPVYSWVVWTYDFVLNGD